MGEPNGFFANQLKARPALKLGRAGDICGDQFVDRNYQDRIFVIRLASELDQTHKNNKSRINELQHTLTICKGSRDNGAITLFSQRLEGELHARRENI